MAFGDTWNKPYYEDALPDGIYRVAGTALNLETTNNGREYLKIESSCMQEDMYGHPITKNVWYMDEPGERQLKGIIRKVLEAEQPGVELSPNSHTVAGQTIHEIAYWLQLRLVGGVFEFRIERQVSAKDGKEYINTWFHHVVFTAQQVYQQQQLQANQANMAAQPPTQQQAQAQYNQSAPQPAMVAAVAVQAPLGIEQQRQMPPDTDIPF